MEFKKYQHLERFGNTEVKGIELGTISVFPKIDGTNASLWNDKGLLKAGSRNRELTLESDNAGFYNWAITQGNLLKFFEKYPTLRLFGEWLVPHSLKTYRDDAWRNFYVFDVMDENERHLKFNEYESILKEFNINYIPPLAVIKNCTYDKLIEFTKVNNYLIKDGEGVGEGIVIKNYDFINKYGRNVFAKIVTSEFKEKHTKEMGASYIEMKNPIEENIVNEFVTKSLCEKEYSKIELKYNGFSNKNIIELLNTVYYELIREESWQFIKKYQNPIIDFRTLQSLVFKKVKENLNM